MNAIVIVLGLAIVFILLVIALLLARRSRGQTDQATATGNRLGPYHNLLPLSEKGGMAKVYKAYNTETGRECVLKVLRSELLGDADAVKKFHREAEILRDIKKKSPDAPVVTVFTTGSISTALVELPFIEMVYVPGNMDLADYLKKNGRLDALTAEKVVVQVLRAIVASHELGVIHRDLKPGNILLYDGDPEKVVVCDFGVAKQVDARSVTMGGYGTAAYMAPEQCESGNTMTEATDIYALGTIFYEMLTGKRLFDDDNPFVVMRRHQEEDPTAKIREKVPEKYHDVLSAMLSKAPDKRPKPEEVLARLSSDALGVEGYRGLDLDVVVRHFSAGAAPGSRSRRWVIAALCGLLVLLVGAMATVFYKSRFIDYGGLYVSTDPAGVELYLDGELLGKTPVELKQVRVGKHTLVAKKLYYQDRTEEVMIEKDEVTRKHLRLTRGLASLEILSKPPGAEVFFDDGKQIGKTPLSLKSILAGRHTLRLHKDRYHDAEVPIELLPAETKRCEVTLRGGNLVLFEGKWLDPKERDQVLRARSHKKEMAAEYAALENAAGTLRQKPFTKAAESEKMARAWADFADKYPDSPDIEAAKQQAQYWRREADRRRKEMAAKYTALVKATKTLQQKSSWQGSDVVELARSWADFVAKYPDSQNISEAKRQAEAWRRQADGRTKEMAGKYAALVNLSRMLEDKSSRTAVESEKMARAWAAFASKYPDSLNIADARGQAQSWRQDAERLRKKEQSQGMLQITSEPVGAEVVVDGRPHGSTPQQVLVSPGIHWIEVKLKGYNDLVRKVDVAGGSFNRIHLILEQEAGTLLVTASPTDALVFVDGELQGQGSPVEIEGLRPGEHKLEVTKDGYLAEELTVRILKGRISKINVVLEKKEDRAARVKKFVHTFLAMLNQGDIDEILSLYDERVDYYGAGLVNKSFIRRDKVSYYKRWPKVRYDLEGEVRIEDDPDPEIKTTAFLIRFDVYNPQRRLGIFGRARNLVKVRWAEDRMLIVKEKQSVLERKSYHG